jgi:divalent metal cation (Fe/Co/Zn/Cd) transporter
VTQEVELASSKISQRIQLVQTVTIVWMAVEAGVSLLAAWTARSPALLAFGGDSLVELLSASVVLWRFTTRSKREDAERTAARTAGILLFVLGAFVIFSAVKSLLGYGRVPNASVLGIGVLVAAIVIMPWLAREKRRLSTLTGSAALRADAAQSNLCGYLALVALVGLVVNVIWRIGWADSVAALAVVPLIVYEGVEALRGRHCGCD